MRKKAIILSLIGSMIGISAFPDVEQKRIRIIFPLVQKKLR